MKIRSLADLRVVEERTRRFSPLGLLTQHLITEEASADFIQKVVAQTELGPNVPEEVRREFETVQRLHTYGLFVYEFFTVTARYALLVLESALRAKFVAVHADDVALVNPRKRQEARIQLTRYDQMEEALGRRGQYPARDGWTLAGLEGPFDGSLWALFRWARSRGYLRVWLDGLWERFRDGVKMSEMSRFGDDRRIPPEYASWHPAKREHWWNATFRPRWELDYIDNEIRLRNLAAHPDPGAVLTPVQSTTAVRQLAAVINSLFADEA